MPIQFKPARLKRGCPGQGLDPLDKLESRKICLGERKRAAACDRDPLAKTEARQLHILRAELGFSKKAVVISCSLMPEIKLAELIWELASKEETSPSLAGLTASTFWKPESCKRLL